MTDAAPSRIGLLGVALLAVAASSTSLANGFAFDDVVIIAGDNRIHQLDAPWRFFTQTYWPPALKSALYRPLTSLAFAVQWGLGDGAPWPFHVTNVVLYVLVGLALYRLAVLPLGPIVGWWAAALFAVHPVHVEAVGNAVGQSELLAALCALVAVGHYVAIRRTRAVTASDVAVISALYATACLFKEHAVMMPALLAAAEVTVLRDRAADAQTRRARGVLAVCLALVAIGFWTVHIRVTGDVAGDLPNIAFAGMSSSDRLLTMLGVVPEWMRLLFAPARLKLDYMPQEVPLANAMGWARLLGVLLIVALATLAWYARRRRPELTFAVLWMACTLFPVSNVVLVSGITLAERTMFMPSVGAMLALGVLVSHLATRSKSWTPGRRRALASVGVALLVIGCVRSAVRHPVWRNSRTFMAQALVDSPRSYRPHWWEARRLYQLGDLAGTKRELDLALALFPADPQMLADAADHFVALDRCDQAVDLYRRSLTLAPHRRWLSHRIVQCLITLGRFDEASREASAALARGDPFVDGDVARLDSIARAP